MRGYDKLLTEAEKNNLLIVEKQFKSSAKGLCVNNVIGINREVETTTEKTCILAEEIGHYHTTAGNILDQSKVNNRKQEKRARRWAHEKLLPLESFVMAYLSGASGRHELADYLEVTEEFLLEAIEQYKEKYGLLAHWGNYIIYFEPLGVMKILDSSNPSSR